MSGALTSLPWLAELRAHGLRPFVLTSATLTPALNLSLTGDPPLRFTMEDPASLPFQRAFLRCQSSSFSGPNSAIAPWVMIDFVMLQTAAIGFAIARADAPAALRDLYAPSLERGLEWLPVSASIMSLAIDGESLVGVSLFSKRRLERSWPKLGLFTKTLALEILRARRLRRYVGVTQFSNPALAIHGQFSTQMRIRVPQIPLHPYPLSFVYEMGLDYDPRAPARPRAPVHDAAWLPVEAAAIERAIIEPSARGARCALVPPYRVIRGGRPHIAVVRDV